MYTIVWWWVQSCRLGNPLWQFSRQSPYLFLVERSGEEYTSEIDVNMQQPRAWLHIFILDAQNACAVLFATSRKRFRDRRLVRGHSQRTWRIPQSRVVWLLLQVLYKTYDALTTVRTFLCRSFVFFPLCCVSTSSAITTTSFGGGWWSAIGRRYQRSSSRKRERPSVRLRFAF